MMADLQEQDEKRRARWGLVVVAKQPRRERLPSLLLAAASPTPSMRPSAMQLALLCLGASALVPPTQRRPPTALRAKAEAFVTEQAPDLLKEIVMKRTSLGEDARRNNARTGGSVKIEHVTLDKIDGNGLEFTCSVKRRAGGFGGGFSAEDETTTANWGDLLECGWEEDQCEVDPDGATAQRRLMQVACSLGLNGDAARLLSTEFPGGLGDAGALPDNLWLNNIPASKEARSHLGDAVCDAVVQAILEEAPTLQVTVKPPELGPVYGNYCERPFNLHAIEQVVGTSSRRWRNAAS